MVADDGRDGHGHARPGGGIHGTDGVHALGLRGAQSLYEPLLGHAGAHEALLRGPDAPGRPLSARELAGRQRHPDGDWLLHHPARGHPLPRWKGPDRAGRRGVLRGHPRGGGEPVEGGRRPDHGDARGGGAPPLRGHGGGVCGALRADLPRRQLPGGEYVPRRNGALPGERLQRGGLPGPGAVGELVAHARPDPRHPRHGAGERCVRAQHLPGCWTSARWTC